VRILHTDFHRGWGGQPARTLMMSRLLAEQGHEVVMATPAGSMLSERARAAGLATFEAVAFRKSKHLLSAWRDASRLARHLVERGYDLVDAHGSQDLWACLLARRLARARLPLVFTRHNTKRVRAHPGNRWLYRRQVDHLIVASSSVLERYEPFLRRGDLRRERVSIVESAYRTDRFHPGVDGRGVRRELGLVDGTPLVGVVGRLVRDKGHDDLLRAAVQILARRPEVLFVMIGTGSREAELKALAARLGVAAAVRFLGFRDDMPELTSALTLSVLPSVDCDASSAVLKEALACGVPAVATDVGGASAILRHGETGIVVPPRDPARLAEAILALLADPERAREMGRRGSRDVAARFGPERLARGTLQAYRTAVARYRQGREIGAPARAGAAR